MATRRGPYRSLRIAFMLALGCAAASISCGKGTTPKGAGDASGSQGGAGGEHIGAQGGGGGTGGETCNVSAAGSTGEPALTWDWTGVIGTGQSLAVGEQGKPVKSTTQPYQNLKLSTGSAEWPLDPEDPSFEMVPLTEPVGRYATGYPSSYPMNIAGETPHSAMGNQISAMVREIAGVEYVGVHGEFGENGQCLRFLEKDADESGVNGRAYEATLVETRAVTRLAEAAGKSYGIGAIIVTHGECDAGNASYAEELYQLWEDYNADLSAITGQTRKIQMLVSQQNSINNRARSTLAQWQIGVDHPEDVVCTGPKYQYPYAPDNIHLVTEGYQMLGEKYGQVYVERVVLGRHWQPLQPERVSRNGRVITVEFHVPVPPLRWDMAFDPPHQDLPEWSNGNGFEVRTSSGRISISSVEISCNSVRIICAEDLPASGVFVGYALTGNAEPLSMPFNGTQRWGRLRDSDPFVGSVTNQPQPNYAVAFELPVP